MWEFEMHVSEKEQIEAIDERELIRELFRELEKEINEVEAKYGELV